MRRLLVVVGGLLSICHAKIIPLASTVTASGTLAASGRSSNNATSIGNEKGVARSKEKERKSLLSIPKLWGRQQAKKESESTAGGDKSGKVSDTDTTGGESATKPAEDGIEDEGVAFSSENGGNAETTETDDTSQPQSTENDGGNEVERLQSEPQSTNQTQTRPGFVYMNIAPPTGPMPMVIPRPMYPYTPQQPPSPNKSSSLLSSILSAMFPRPQNMPPMSPYGPPPMQPSSPYAPGGNNAINSLLLRLALISFGTLLLDVLGLGSQSDAFLPTPSQHYTFERVNDRYRRDRSALSQALESPPPGIGKHRWRHAFWRRRREVQSSLALAEESSVSVVESPTLANGALYNRTVIIVDMKPDSRVGHGMAEHLRDTVSFIIEQHRDYVDMRSHAEKAYSFKHQLPSFLFPRSSSTASPSHNHRTPNGMRPALGNDIEVVLFLDSPGGTVQDYGLASSQLARLRDEPQIILSVCVDRVAASGGYMMACQATPGHLFAAPFAMIGSIGVLMETVNVNEVLKRYGVKPLVIKAGKNKAPLKTFGEVSDEEMQMAQDDADVIHEAFQKWVMQSRPNVVVSQDWIEKVCTGAVFLGKEARELGLVDRVLTSDEYVAEKISAGDRVLRLIPYKGPQFGIKISPLDLLLSSMDAEGRLKIHEKARVLGMRIIRCTAPLFRVGVAVGLLNHLASLQSPYHGYTWAA